LLRRDLGDHGIGDGADQVRRDVDRVHLLQERLNLAHRQAARVQRQDLVIEPGEPTLVLADQLRFRCAVAIARRLDRERPVIGQGRLAARPIAVIGVSSGFVSPGAYPR
jgi:hypothetical protein